MLIVKRYFNWRYFGVHSMLVLLIGVLTACGQRGPLYLPNQPKESAAPAKPILAPSPDKDNSTTAVSK
jgi:predicted small lipoprotein YifL